MTIPNKKQSAQILRFAAGLSLRKVVDSKAFRPYVSTGLATKLLNNMNYTDIIFIVHGFVNSFFGMFLFFGSANLSPLVIIVQIIIGFRGIHRLIRLFDELFDGVVAVILRAGIAGRDAQRKIASVL